MSKQCEIVQDLLPLYVDGACSESSAEMIKEHLETCADCRAVHEQMCSHTNEDILQKEKDGVVKRHERKESQKVIKYIFFALAIIYVPALFFVALFADGDGTFISIPYSFILLVLFVYTVPFYFAFIEISRLVCSMLDKKKDTIGETVFNIIGCVLAIISIAVGIMATAFDLDGLIYADLGLAALLGLTWLISAIIFKKKPNLKSTFQDKTFWICVAILMVVAALLTSIPIVLTATENVREAPLQAHYSIGYRDNGTEYEGLYFDIGAEEQHSWDVIGENPSFTVKWVNETGKDIEYNMECYIYKKTKDGWGLCSTDYIDFPDVIHTIKNGETKSQIYSIDGYDLNQSGQYKFVTFVDNKAVWVEFEVTIEFK
ncbi:MAG: zf-HC2 domain-containing protein [Clostridia bacterium]|nr:zf-HC2 domain-containing protein [Clostridia bacterium]